MKESRVLELSAVESIADRAIFQAALPPFAAGSWCRIRITIAGDRLWWAKAEATDTARGQVVREVFLGPPRRTFDGVARATMIHFPAAAESLVVSVFREDVGQPSAAWPAPVLELGIYQHRRAALALLASCSWPQWRRLAVSLAGDPAGLIGRVRAVLGQTAARQGEAPPYRFWIGAYDQWSDVRDSLMARIPPARIAIVIICGDTAFSLLERTEYSIERQWLPANSSAIVVREPADWAALDGDWILVLGAGEVLAPQALACFVHAFARTSQARGFYADMDYIDAGGERSKPLFKPDADPWLLRSGLLTRGACLFARAGQDWENLPVSADAARLKLAVSLPVSTFIHLPAILTHSHVPVAPIPRLPSLAARHGNSPSVSIVIPTAARSAHMLRCLRRVASRTSYEAFEIVLAVSAIDPSDRTRACILRAAAGIAKLRIVEFEIAPFNFAAVNNKAAATCTSDLLLLLNDDVSPIEADWLHRMVAAICTPPYADIVGAKLLYGDGSVQHGGVVMGLGNLCEHAFRLMPRNDAGPHGIACLDRQVSAVTAACMLVRRSLFEELGGFDEAFAIALNDVDFCLRAGVAQARIVYAADVELYHYESLSLGRHYSGARAGLEAIEVRRLRRGWAERIANDPFYSLSASLEIGRDWQPAFPPRITPISWMDEEGLAQS